MGKALPLPQVECAFLLNISHIVEEMLYNIVADYCRRFNVSITDEYDRIVFCGYDSFIHGDKGQTTMGANGTIHVQILDPWLLELEANPLVCQMFATIMAHEMVHVAQALTGREGLKLRIPYDKNDANEEYFFDPAEMEAYLLENLYMSKYGTHLKEYGKDL